MDLSKIEVCTTHLPEDAPGTNLLSSPSEASSLTMPMETFWPNGKRILVSFLRGGSVKVRKKVVFYAQQWERFANVDFRFVDYATAERTPDIRISFDMGKGSSSAIGTNCKKYKPDEPTMNFGWFDDDTRDEEFSRTVLHEFGHALGCVHEHSNPNVVINWDKPKVYAYYQGPPNNWTKQKVDKNLFSIHNAQKTEASEFDDRSIMLYSIPASFTTDGKGTPRNTVLSPRDQSFIAMMYPFQTRSSGVWSTTEARPSVPPVAMNTKQVVFNTAYPTEPDIALGLNELDIDESHHLRVKAFVERVTPQNFVLRIDAWSDTRLYSGGATWIEFNRSDSDYQVGTWDLDKPEGKSNSKRVNFMEPFLEAPKVVVWISGLDMDKDHNVRIQVYADRIDQNGFDIHADTWADSILDGATVTWIAYESSKEGIASGSDGTHYFKRWFPAEHINGRKVSFNGAFDKIPKVYTAISRLDFDASRNVRFKAFPSDVTEAGFRWNVNSWEDSLCYGAGISWIAFG